MARSLQLVIRLQRCIHVSLEKKKIAREEKNSCVVFGELNFVYYPDELFYKPLIRLQRCPLYGE